MKEQIIFTAHVVSGAGRGKTLGAPTLNLAVSDVPKELGEGIYACTVQLGKTIKAFPAAMHYGPPVYYSETPTCEVHILERSITDPPDRVSVAIVEYLRPIMNFASEEDLIAQIQKDIEQARAILVV